MADNALFLNTNVRSVWAGVLTKRNSSLMLCTMRTEELDYPLPEELIAMHPAQPRDSCKLLVCSRSDPNLVEHRVFRDIREYLQPGDVTVFNTSAVVPARLAGKRADSGGKVEGLFLQETETPTQEKPGVWKCLLKSNSKLRSEQVIELVDAQGNVTGDTLTLLERDGDGWLVRATPAPGQSKHAPEILARAGATPLPPYILSKRKGEVAAGADETLDDADRAWYQTVYANLNKPGSVAAPTAGLHFTPAVLEQLRTKGVDRADVVLHVGAGTFKPITVDDLTQHEMHAEVYEVPSAAAASIARAKEAGGRVIAVGTTSARTLESLPKRPWEQQQAFAGDTSIFITPGHAFQHVDGIITNFHLPKSTLIAMIGALFEGEQGSQAPGQGVPRLIELYKDAADRGYQFFSYGDAMLILP